MKKAILAMLLFSAAGRSEAFALAVIDSSNLAQNIVAAREAVTQTQQQIQQLQAQLNQYKRMLQDAMNPGQWVWGDIRDAIDQLKNTMGSIRNLSDMTGGFDRLLGEFGSYDDYASGEGYGGPPSAASAAAMSGDHAGSRLQKETADDLLRVVKEQREQLDEYQERFDRLKDQAASAEGQQEAIQAGNEFASLQIQSLSQIHALLLAQNTMLAARVEADNNREARQRMGTAIKMGESDMFGGEREGAGRSYSFIDM
ncbi:MAG: P-type conjugative transfer protein TrbJ [Planctomycetota bacterium]|nr:P-type conjugative transfer protein TrbJ [Planctomycetota bacterium]